LRHPEKNLAIILTIFPILPIYPIRPARMRNTWLRRLQDLRRPDGNPMLQDRTNSEAEPEQDDADGTPSAPDPTTDPDDGPAQPEPGTKLEDPASSEPTVATGPTSSTVATGPAAMTKTPAEPVVTATIDTADAPQKMRVRTHLALPIKSRD